MELYDNYQIFNIEQEEEAFQASHDPVFGNEVVYGEAVGDNTEFDDLWFDEVTRE